MPLLRETIVLFCSLYFSLSYSLSTADTTGFSIRAERRPLNLDNIGIDCAPRLANPSKHQPRFPTNQPWFRVGKELRFIDENASTIFGNGQVPEFEDNIEELSAEILDSNPSLHLEGTATGADNQILTQTLTRGGNLDSVTSVGQSQGSIRFETLVEAAAGCRAECSSSAPTDPRTEATTDTTLPNSTTGISPVFEPTHDARDSFVRSFPQSNQRLNRNDALSPANFRAFEPSRDPPAGRITSISPEAAFSLSTTPTLTAHEARLMQHFIEHLAPSIDVVCSSQVFGRLVPRMAFLSPILLTSIFAVASKHISKTIETTDPAPETYFQETLDHLIPVLNEPDALVEDYILAAVVILRVMEEMDSTYRDKL